MYNAVIDTLNTQEKAYEFLSSFLDYEYNALIDNDMDLVFEIEESIHTALAIIYWRRTELTRQLNGRMINEYAADLPEIPARVITRKGERIRELEESCTRRSGRNAALANTLAASGNYLATVLTPADSEIADKAYGRVR